MRLDGFGLLVENMAKNKPGIVTVPSMNYIAVQGSSGETDNCDQASN